MGLLEWQKVFAHFETFTGHFSGGTEENHLESQFLMPVSRLRFQTVTCPVEPCWLDSLSPLHEASLWSGSLVTAS